MQDSKPNTQAVRMIFFRPKRLDNAVANKNAGARPPRYMTNMRLNIPVEKPIWCRQISSNGVTKLGNINAEIIGKACMGKGNEYSLISMFFSVDSYLFFNKPL